MLSLNVIDSDSILHWRLIFLGRVSIRNLDYEICMGRERKYKKVQTVDCLMRDPHGY
jgi:hypothetical protein